MSSSVRLSVCRLSSVCNVRAPYSADWNFRHLIRWWPDDIQVKFYGDRPRGTPPSGVKPKSVRKNVAILDLCEAISRKRCKIGGKLVLITNRKSHMGFRLVPNSMTLNDLERRNRPNGCLISPTPVAFWADCVTVVEDTRILSAAEM